MNYIFKIPVERARDNQLDDQNIASPRKPPSQYESPHKHDIAPISEILLLQGDKGMQKEL